MTVFSCCWQPKKQIEKWICLIFSLVRSFIVISFLLVVVSIFSIDSINKALVTSNSYFFVKKFAPEIYSFIFNYYKQIYPKEEKNKLTFFKEEVETKSEGGIE